MPWQPGDPWNGSRVNLSVGQYANVSIGAVATFDPFTHVCQDAVADDEWYAAETVKVKASFKYTNPPGLAAQWCVWADASRKWLLNFAPHASNTFCIASTAHTARFVSFYADVFAPDAGDELQWESGGWYAVMGKNGPMHLSPSVTGEITSHWQGSCADAFYPSGISVGHAVVVSKLGLRWYGLLNGNPVNCHDENFELALALRTAYNLTNS